MSQINRFPENKTQSKKSLFFCCGTSLEHTYQPSPNENSGHDKTVLEITQSYSTPRPTSQRELLILENNHLNHNQNVTLDVLQEKETYFLKSNEAEKFRTRPFSHIEAISPEMNKFNDRNEIYKIKPILSDDNADELKEVSQRHRLSSEEAISISTTMTTIEMESPNIFPYMNRMKKATGAQLPSSDFFPDNVLTGIANHLQRIEKKSEDVARRAPLFVLPSNMINENKIIMVLVYSEVMQLKGTPREAVPILQSTIIQLTAHNSACNSDSYDNSSSSSSSAVDLSELLHVSSLHRRLGSVLKSAGDFVQSEKHIRAHLALIEILLASPAGGESDSPKPLLTEKGLSLTLLASVLDKLGRASEAVVVDQEALGIILSIIQH